MNMQSPRRQLGRPWIVLVLIALPFSGGAVFHRPVNTELSSPLTSSDPTPELAERRAACGFNSLYLLMHLKNCPVDFSELERKLPIQKKGNSILSLKKIAKQMGMATTIVRVEASELHQLKMPIAILVDSQQIDELSKEDAGQDVQDFTNVGHYFVVTDASPQQLELIDGTTGRQISLEMTKVHPNWIQAALVPTDHPSDQLPWISLAALTTTLTTIAVFCFFKRSD